jgi:hypothetical protein
VIYNSPYKYWPAENGHRWVVFTCSERKAPSPQFPSALKIVCNESSWIKSHTWFHWRQKPSQKWTFTYDQKKDDTPVWTNMKEQQSLISIWNRYGILLPKSFWPNVRKNVLEPESQKFVKFLRSLEQFFWPVKGQTFVTKCSYQHKTDWLCYLDHRLSLQKTKILTYVHCSVNPRHSTAWDTWNCYKN